MDRHTLLQTCEDASKNAQKMLLRTCGTNGLMDQLTDQHSNLWSCVHATENPHIWLRELVISNYFNSWRGYIHSCACSFFSSSVSPFINHWIQNILYNVHAWSWPLVTIYQSSFSTEWTLIQRLNVLINASLPLKWWMLQVTSNRSVLHQTFKNLICILWSSKTCQI